MMSVKPHYRTKIRRYTDARDLWAALAAEFKPKGSAQAITLRRQLNMMAMEDYESPVIYFLTARYVAGGGDRTGEYVRGILEELRGRGAGEGGGLRRRWLVGGSPFGGGGGPYARAPCCDRLAAGEKRSHHGRGGGSGVAAAPGGGWAAR